MRSGHRNSNLRGVRPLYISTRELRRIRMANNFNRYSKAENGHVSGLTCTIQIKVDFAGNRTSYLGSFMIKRTTTSTETRVIE